MPIRDESDDVDRFFAALESLPAPANLLERALTEAAAREERRRLRILCFAIPGYAAILLALMLLSFALGRTIASYGAGAILALVVADPRAVLIAPDDLVLAVVENLPFGLVAALAVTTIVLAWCVQLAAGVLGAPRSRPMKARARHG